MKFDLTYNDAGLCTVCGLGSLNEGTGLKERLPALQQTLQCFLS